MNAQPDLATVLKRMSPLQKGLLGLVVVCFIGFMGFMAYTQNSQSQEDFRVYYQEYTIKVNATVTDVSTSHSRGRTSFATTIVFTTDEWEEISTRLPNNEFIKSEWETLDILYKPNYPNSVVAVSEYEYRTGLKAE